MKNTFTDPNNAQSGFIVEVAKSGKYRTTKFYNTAFQTTKWFVGIAPASFNEASATHGNAKN